MLRSPIRSSFRFQFAICAGIVGSAAVPAFAQNLLTNPGFEAPLGGATNWNAVNGGDRAPFFNNTPGGMFSLWAKTFQPIGGGAIQDVGNISVGANYTLSSKIYFEEFYNTTTAVIQLGLTFLDSGNSPVGTPSFLNIQPTSNPPFGTWADPGGVPWQVMGTAPAGATKVRAFLGWMGGGTVKGAQSVFFDDAVLLGPGIPPSGATWAVGTSGDWNVLGNWSTGVVPNGAAAEATLGGIITTAQTVYSNAAITVSTLNFNNANTYVVAGAGSLTLAGSGRINVAAGSHKVNLPLSLSVASTADVAAGATLFISDPVTLNGNSLTKTGPGTLNIEAPVRSTGPGLVRVSGGTTNVNFEIGTPATGAAAAVATTALNVDGSRAVLNANQTLRNLDAVTTNAGDQEIDLAGSRARVYAASLTTEELSIYNDIRAARTSASGKDGIYSSLDDAGNNFSVGVTDTARDAHNDLSVLTRLTRTGDANVDGTTNISDFSVLSSNFNQPGRWDNGDFNYDGTTNIGDFSLLSANFNQSAGDLSRGSAVPEPATMGVIGLALAGLATRRRNRA